MHLITEARNGGSVDSDAVFEGTLQLVGHDGDVLGLAMNIAKCQTDELDILLQDVLHDFFL